jgi:UDP-glucose:(heptosyl)LPS alpha-1,3-glucosyltransferase
VNAKRCIAVVSPFLDKQHGTERCVAEQVERLARDYEVHVYSNRVEDLDLSRIVWHRVPALPGPHLFAYGWWFLANHLWRWWSRHFRGVHPALVYSPGINCLDAGLISVHAVFAEVESQVRESLSLRGAPLRFWPRRIHRQIYYRLVRALERRIYTRLGLTLVCVSQRVAGEISRHYHRERSLHVIPNAVDSRVFNSQVRLARREAARRELGIQDRDVVLLLIGNDLKSKGLPCVLEAIAGLRPTPLRLLVVSRDLRATAFQAVPGYGQDARGTTLDTAPPRHASVLPENEWRQHVRFLEPSPDVMKFYAASDLYVGPSLHDSFALPPLEAMACGLPVIASSRSGVAEIISSGTDALVLEDPTDASQLAELVSHLYHDPDLRQRIGENAERTARQWTWDQNAAALGELIEKVLASQEHHPDEGTCSRPAPRECRRDSEIHHNVAPGA